MLGGAIILPATFVDNDSKISKGKGFIVQGASTPPIQALEKAIVVFEQICKSDSPLRLVDLSRSLNMNKTTVFRILQTFISLGYVEQEKGTDRYSSTLKIAAFSNLVLNRVEIRHVARDILLKLANELNESVHLSVSDQGEAVIVDKVEAETATRISFHIGRRSPLYATGTGKMMLAGFSREELNRYFERTELIAHTPTTLASKGELLAALDRIREQGISFDREENNLGISCVAAPIYDYSGRIVSGISVVGSTSRITTLFESIIPKLLMAARAISSRMGATSAPLT